MCDSYKKILVSISIFILYLDYLGVSGPCISKSITKFKEQGSVEILPRSGRPKKMTDGLWRKIIMNVINDMFATVWQKNNSLNNI